MTDIYIYIYTLIKKKNIYIYTYTYKKVIEKKIYIYIYIYIYKTSSSHDVSEFNTLEVNAELWSCLRSKSKIFIWISFFKSTV